MKKTLCVVFAVLLLLSACAVETTPPSQAPLTWQEQYDLGMKYLSEGNYEEAVLAFTAAIEIDPKKADAYVGRGDAYINSGETAESLAAAQSDYETAMGLDETLAKAYLGLADVYIRMGEYEKAWNILKIGLEKTENDADIAKKLEEIEGGQYTDSANRVRRSNDYSLENELIGYTIYEYDFLGRCNRWSNYDRELVDGEAAGEFKVSNIGEATFDEQGRVVGYQFYEPDGTPTKHDTFVYNEAGQKAEQYRYDADGGLDCYFYFYYDEKGQESKYEGYHADGSMYIYSISEYDENGNLISETYYNPDGTQESYSVYE